MTDQSLAELQPEIIEPLDFETILARRKAKLLSLVPEVDRPDLKTVLALESEPITYLLEESAYNELLLRARANEVARSRFVAFAYGNDLDLLGEFYDLPRLKGETDERYRVRLLLRIAAMAGNGTEEAYRLHAMTASLAVQGAAVRSDRAGYVQVVIWTKPGVDQEAIRQTVTDYLTREPIRVLGVDVTVHAARLRAVDIRATVWRDATAPLDVAVQLVKSMRTAIEDQSGLGKGLSQSWIVARLHVSGVSRVVLDSPDQDLILESDEYMVPGDIIINDGGMQW